MNKILVGCDEFPIKGIYGEGNRKRLKAMILLLRHTGLRIRDAVTITRDRLQNGRVFLYTQKTGTPVHVPVPPVVTAALAEVTKIHDENVFWTGAGGPKSAVADWQRSFPGGRATGDAVGAAVSLTTATAHAARSPSPSTYPAGSPSCSRSR
ncbi:MAG: tyrosine-type recombinase/integrase [Acidobacteriota bacterium]